ncbi:MAG: EcsC family protein [Rhodanobacteraceae bacterium]
MTASLAAPAGQPSQRIAQQILDYLSDIPSSREHPREHPRARVEAIALAARRKAFLASSSLALPPGPIGWLTVLPELVAIWKIQAQMVADIAAVCGEHPKLTREQMLFCLFRHAAAQAVRDLAVRTGQRWMVHAATTHGFRSIVHRIGVKLSERALGSSLARMVPLAGALGVGAYAWYDTRQVARTAFAMFSREVEIIPARRSAEVPAQRTHRDRAQDAREAGL